VKLLTKALEKKLPALRGASGTAYVKWFTPDSNWTWYVMEYDPETGDCFGLVDGLEKEMGYFNLKEISEIRGKFGLPVERDQWFDPTPVEELLK
jgi:hypothetical protein